MLHRMAYLGNGITYSITYLMKLISNKVNPADRCAPADFFVRRTWRAIRHKGLARRIINNGIIKDTRMSICPFNGCTPDITSQIRENDGLGKKTKRFPSDYSESKIEG
jgi:hypothetical protein